ncbi:hypothetical protein BY996DRAFT_6484839 [Phakopsora pachyrhizi]|nr:hypothetical protein BY996DRAFT_6484839 [Phakopsora pachyrhizi]
MSTRRKSSRNKRSITSYYNQEQRKGGGEEIEQRQNIEDESEMNGEEGFGLENLTRPQLLYLNRNCGGGFVNDDVNLEENKSSDYKRDVVSSMAIKGVEPLFKQSYCKDQGEDKESVQEDGFLTQLEKNDIDCSIDCRKLEKQIKGWRTFGMETKGSTNKAWGQFLKLKIYLGQFGHLNCVIQKSLSWVPYQAIMEQPKFFRSTHKGGLWRSWPGHHMRMGVMEVAQHQKTEQGSANEDIYGSDINSKFLVFELW